MKLYVHHEPSELTLLIVWPDSSQETVADLKKKIISEHEKKFPSKPIEVCFG